MTRVKHVSREKYIKYRQKAEQFFEGMQSEYENGRYGTSVTMAVHCAISWVDAFTIFRLGKKSSAQSHVEAITLLKDSRTSNQSEKARICQKLYQLIEMKTPAEYDDTIMSKSDAERAKNLCIKIRVFLRDELKRAEVLNN